MRNLPKNIQFVFCSFVPTGLEDYVTYFQNNFSDFIYLKWKFPHGDDKFKSTCEKYKDGKLIKKDNLYSFRKKENKFFYFLFLPFNYLTYLFQAIKYLRYKQKDKVRIFMGINYYCTFCGIILKKLGKVDYVVYRVMDFFPVPKSGFYKFLNKIFHKFDKYCLNNSDSIWFTTKGHIIGREKYGYFDRNKSNYQMIPLTVDMKKFTIKNPHNKDMIYCGMISKYHMFDLIFDVVEEISKKHPDFRLKIIGGGPDKDYYEKLAKNKNLDKNIIFYGFMPENQKFRDLMADNILGIALYKDEEDYMKYTEPAKVKYYLNFGVPVVVSRVPQIAKELDEKKVAFSVKNNKDEIVAIIDKYLNHKSMQSEYKNNIKKFIKSVDINYLLDKNFQETFNKLKLK